MPNIKHDIVTYHTHHTHHAIYIVIHTLHPPPHQGGEHTPTIPQGGRGTVLWLTHDHGGGRRGVGTLDRIYVCMYIYVCVCSYLQMLQQLPTGSQCRQSHRRLLLHKRDRWEDKQLHPQAHTFHITGIKSSRFWGSLRFFDSWTIVNLMARDLLRLNYLNMFLRCVGF